MSLPVYVFDPTAEDSLSKVRGIGRYLQLLRECFADEFIFTSKLHEVPQQSVLINPFVNTIGTPLVTKRYAAVQIGIFHDLIPLKFPAYFPLGLRGWLQHLRNRFDLRLYDHYVTNSDTTTHDVVKMMGIEPKRITRIYPFVPSTLSSPDTLPAPYPSPYYLYVGDATWNKNLVVMARALMKAHLPCIFTGKTFEQAMGGFSELDHPWQHELKEFVDLVDDNELFIFPGYVSDEKLRNYYHHALANLLFSRDEGFGFSYIEAGIQGTPSILSDIPTFHETAQTAALFIQPNDVQSIADTLKSFAVDPKQRDELGAAAQARTHTFSAQQFKAGFQTLLQPWLG